jgi:hypothetical protein
MGREKLTASEEEIKKIYEPDYFYEHGSNPAYKKFVDIASENIIAGDSPDYRACMKDNQSRYISGPNLIG